MPNDYDIPEEYLCPITFELMLEPVKASDGYIYEKKAILDWYRQNKTSPFTREELTSEFIFQNELHQKIMEIINKFDLKVQKYTEKNKDKSKNNSRNAENRNINRISQEYEFINNPNPNPNSLLITCNRCFVQLYIPRNNISRCPNCNNTFSVLNCRYCSQINITGAVDMCRFYNRVFFNCVNINCNRLNRLIPPLYPDRFEGYINNNRYRRNDLDCVIL